MALLIISPENGPFRKKIKQKEETINAYRLLHKNQNYNKQKIRTQKKIYSLKLPQNKKSMPKLKSIAAYSTIIYNQKLIYYKKQILIQE